VRPSEPKEGKEAVMKRIRLLVLLGVVAVALPLGVTFAGGAGAAGTSGTTNSVSINQYADFEDVGETLDIGLVVRCKSATGKGAVDVTVTQEPPETPYPLAAGSGPQAVVCDGRSHSVGVTIGGVFFDAGKAYATADVTTTDNPLVIVAHAERTIQIRVV
jgi:hypothetical protein